MGLTGLTRVGTVLLLAITSAVPGFAQNARVHVGKLSTAIPKTCESVVPASLDGTVDVLGLVKEAICKGDGDMLIEYTYVMNIARREKDKKGKAKETAMTYEVFIPTLKSGAHTKGVLVVTRRNGVPVPAAELEESRVRAAERIEKEEEKIARETPSPREKEPNSASRAPKAGTSPVVVGMLPLGMYTRSTINRSTLFINRGSAALDVTTFLRTCELTLLRREIKNGRDTLVFKFTPRPDAQFNDNEKYVAQLKGEIWIDSADRIVKKLVGWPAIDPVRDGSASGASDEKPPTAYFEMLRLPTGVWLPQVSRINGADYPKLLEGVKEDVTATYSNYIRFFTEVKDVKMETPKKP